MTSVARAPYGRSASSIFARRRTAGFLYSLPAVLVVAFFVVYPLIHVIDLSFERSTLASISGPFAGWLNYKNLWNYPVLGQVAANTIWWVFGGTALTMIVGLLLGLHLSSDGPITRALRFLLLLPWVLPVVVSGTTWKWMMNSTNGVLDDILLKLHLVGSGIAWLGTPGLALLMLMVAFVWRLGPLAALMVHGVVLTIPASIQEAAIVDGAGGIRRFFSITLPSISGTLVTVSIINMIWIVKNIVIIIVMTGGGPENSTNTIANLVYQLGFTDYRFGLSNALAVINFLVTGALAAVYLYLFRSRWLPER